MKIEDDFYLNLEQAKRLKELGLNKEYSLKCYTKDKDGTIALMTNSEGVLSFFDIKEYIPTYSLHEILDILPKSISYKDEKFYLNIDFKDKNINYGIFAYITWNDDNYLDAAYDMLEMLLKNGYLNKEVK